MSNLYIRILLGILQSILILGIAPFLIGYIRKIKAKLQNRVGPPILQPYYELYKLFRKDTIVSKNTSFIFLSIPYVFMGIMILISLLIPVFTLTTDLIQFSLQGDSSFLLFDNVADIISLIYLFSLSTFLLVLAAFDTGSSFGGLGAARHYMFSVICEPLIFSSFLIPVLFTKTTQISQIISVTSSINNVGTLVIYIIGLISFFLALLAENSRFPFDNPSTHLELTMVHEAMVLEYSGKHLALIEWGSWVKLTLFLTICSTIFFPFGINTGELTPKSILIGLGTYFIKTIFLATLIALIESTIAKLRIFKLPALLSLGFLLSVVSIIYIIIFTQ